MKRFIISMDCGILCFCFVLLMFLAMTLSARPVQAALVNENFGFFTDIPGYFTGTNLQNATSVRFNTSTNYINYNPETYLGNPQTINLYTWDEAKDETGNAYYADKLILPSKALVVSGIHVGEDDGSVPYQTVDYGSFLIFGPTGSTTPSRFEFDMTGVKFFSTDINSLTLEGIGILRDTVAEYDSTPANISIDITYDGHTNYSGSFATAAPVPIPSAIWLLGSAFIGLVGCRRKFKR